MLPEYIRITSVSPQPRWRRRSRAAEARSSGDSGPAGHVEPQPNNDLAAWEFVEAGTLETGAVSLQLPERSGGVWLLWLTDLPEREPSVFFSEIAEVAFGP